MTCIPPDGFDDYVKTLSTKTKPIPHWVVIISTTPPDALERLKKYDQTLFEFDGLHAIEFLETDEDVIETPEYDETEDDDDGA
jgi:hypothetical protein